MKKWYLRPQFDSERGDNWGYYQWAEVAAARLTKKQVKAFNKAFGDIFEITDVPDPPPDPEVIRRNKEASMKSFVEWGPMAFRGSVKSDPSQLVERLGSHPLEDAIIELPKPIWEME